jgi:hypothetical protein
MQSFVGLCGKRNRTGCGEDEYLALDRERKPEPAMSQTRKYAAPSIFGRSEKREKFGVFFWVFSFNAKIFKKREIHKTKDYRCIGRSTGLRPLRQWPTLEPVAASNFNLLRHIYNALIPVLLLQK